jgi:mRNA interferase YafQ
MRTIRRTARFKKDFKREAKGRHSQLLDTLPREALALMASDAPMPERYRDHALTGEWRDYRDCHLRPDLVLIYRKPDSHHLDLVRLGSHGELGV